MCLNLKTVKTLRIFLPTDACGALEVYSGTKFSVPIEIEDTKSCFEMINAILKCVISLEQEHLQYRKAVQRETISGSL